MPVLRNLVTVLSLMAGLAAVAPRSASAQQELAYSDRAPRFLAFVDGGVKPVDVKRTAVLNQRLALDLDGVTVKAALEEILARSSLRLVYREELLPVNATVHLRASEITVAAALAAVLLDAGVDVGFDRSGGAVLVRRPADGRPPMGTIAGLVTDTKTGAVLGGATIVVEGTSRSATSSTDGRYRITEVAPGTYTVRARYIGYTPGTASVTVGADQEAAADFALEKSVQKLDEVVTTGTVVPTEVKALPTPVTVVTESDVRQQRPSTLFQLLREAVPGAVSWDFPGFPSTVSISARGASSFTGGSMKVYLDGIEISNALYAAIDPSSVERVEVIRGPQASTIYGSQAIGGVIQVFTKRGDSTLTRPQVDASSAVGIVQSPYPGFGGTARERFAGSVRGGGPGYSYSFGGSYAHLGEWVPEGAQSLPSVYAGVRLGSANLMVDLTGRYYQQSLGQTFNPLILNTGAVSNSKPYPWPLHYHNETLGARATWVATPWLRQQLTVGIDRAWLDVAQTGPRLTTPADTLLYVSDESQPKLSMAYNAAVSGSLTRDFSANVVAGIDHFYYEDRLYYTGGALNATGAISTASPISGSRVNVTNTGYFGQAQLSYRSSLFLTAGVRAEENSSFGSALGTPISPRVGLAYAVNRGGAFLKLRGSYGEAIRPPDPGFSGARPSFGASSQIGNPILGPERQKGWDVGLDLVLGDRASVSATYYDQTAQDLIGQVILSLSPTAYQYQNVGRVKNKGLELEGRVNVGPARLTGQFAVTDSRIEDLGPDYTGDLRVNERPFLPKYTAGAMLALSPLRGTTVTGGMAYVGSWTNYDLYAFNACLGSTGPCRPAFRDYLTTYPGFVKFDLSVSQTLTQRLAGFIAVHNVGDNAAYESTNFSAAMGRTTMVGLELR